MTPGMIFLYGPSGSGKSTSGKILAENLGLPFYDLDSEIETRVRGDGSRAASKDQPGSIAEIFKFQGEAAFRALEKTVLEQLCQPGTPSAEASVIALGGGALTTPACRALAESAGRIICLQAAVNVLRSRLQSEAHLRPLLSGNEAQAADQREHLNDRLARLLERRASHYASFPLQLDTSALTPEETAWQAQIALGRFRLQGMGEPYDVLIQTESLAALGDELRRRGLGGPAALVCDENTAARYASRAAASLQSTGYTVHTVIIPAGENHKTIATVEKLWEGFLQAGLERGSTVVALGGGVVGDLAGFAAATYLRGVAWVNLPTTLLAMVDAGIGGKTGADLPQGKNLVGAFHPPRLVLIDPTVLTTLPPEELRSGMAEVVKHALIADAPLFERCEYAPAAILQALSQEANIVARALAVKARIIQADPYEKGLRAVLNLGHTLGHAVEKASNYQLRHGEAVAIGLVAEARLAESLGVAAPADNVAMRISSTLQALGLPTEIPPGLERAAILNAMRVDKKKAAGKLKFALPVRIGEARVGVMVDEATLEAIRFAPREPKF